MALLLNLNFNSGEKRLKVKVISYSQPPNLKIYDQEENNLETIEDLIAYCARVSNPSNQANKETNSKLIQYLAAHSHWSPFEMVSVCMEVETTRDIARQILRHKSFGFQEFSMRYSNPIEEDLGFVIREARLQDFKNRQNSVEIDDEDLQSAWAQKQKEIIELVKTNYKWAIDKGIAKEQARVILPEGNTVSKMYINGTIRSWIHYCELRSKHGTQKEHTEIALAIADLIAKIFPTITKFI